MAPKTPVSNKERKKMLKSTARRLASMIGARPTVILKAGTAGLYDMLNTFAQKPSKDASFGDARRLAAKLTRLARRLSV